MHIVFVEGGYPHSHGGGGAGTYVQIVGCELVKRGCQVSVLSDFCAQCPNEFDDEGIAVWRPHLRSSIHYYLGKAPLLGKISLAVRSLEMGWLKYRFIERLHEIRQIDVVEFTEGGDFWHVFRRPFVSFVHLHGSRYTCLAQSNKQLRIDDWSQRQLELSFIQRADYIVSPSNAILDIVSKEARGLRPPYLQIPYPIVPSPSENADDEPDRPLRVIFAARNDPVKGADLLLLAIPLVVEQVPSVEFHFFGFQPKPGQAIPDCLTTHPFVPRHEMLAWLRKVDICVVPSRWDNSPYTVYEAMAAGKPIVATTVGGIPELVEDGETGLLVPPDNVTELVDAIVRLLQQPERRKMMGLAAREHILHLANLEQNVDRRLQLYETAISRKKAAT